MNLNKAPTATAALRIRRPVAEVFEAFVDPDAITKFWFDRSTGRLDENRTVQWFWESCDACTTVRVIEIVDNQKIRIEWDAGTENATIVTWDFQNESSESTYVSIANEGFSGSDDEIVSKALDATGGFNLVLAAAKSWLEHGVDLRIVEDRFPMDD